jgi:protein required for attachment to host cells/ribosome-associated translation inhibitor RaiA
MPRSDVTWIVVMDSAQARVFALGSGRDGRELRLAMPPLTSALGRHSRDERSDKPGRSFASIGGVRHAIEPRHDYHKLAKHNFARSVAALVENASVAHQFDHLVLVAPRRSLGEMRALLSRQTTQRVQHEIAKDFTLLEPHELWSRIAPLLMATTMAPGVAVGSKTNRKPPQSANDAPVVMFRKMKPSAAIQDSVIRHAEKLRRLHARVTSCKVTVEGEHGHHRKGPLYRVYVDLRIPGRKITAASTARQAHAHDDVYAAIRDAFVAAQRQLVNFTQRASNAPSQGARSSSLRRQRVEVV